MPCKKVKVFLPVFLMRPVIVAALGYFVDIYDLVLFSIVRVPSLKGLGVAGGQLMSDGLFLINMQMFGMLVGGVFWGILGDPTFDSFGSIITYSLGKILPTDLLLRLKCTQRCVL